MTTQERAEKMVAESLGWWVKVEPNYLGQMLNVIHHPAELAPIICDHEKAHAYWLAVRLQAELLEKEGE